MTTFRTNMAAFLVVASLIALPAPARDVASGALRLSAAWIPLTSYGASTAAGYVSITNTGRTSDRMMAGETAMATSTEIHLTSTAANITRMRQVQDGVPLQAGQTVVLRPGGYHFMFVGLKRLLHVGDHIPVLLKFAYAPGVQIDFVVEKYTGQAATTSRMPMPERPM